ncbi:hypothetical protein DFH06DRAFT_1476096 [Mycena polygramma]|nr:hypothetical protein DFH06DRAFT_1476096 [Mycena polygramma]
MDAASNTRRLSPSTALLNALLATSSLLQKLKFALSARRPLPSSLLSSLPHTLSLHCQRIAATSLPPSSPLCTYAQLPQCVVVSSSLALPNSRYSQVVVNRVRARRRTPNSRCGGLRRRAAHLMPAYRRRRATRAFSPSTPRIRHHRRASAAHAVSDTPVARLCSSPCGGLCDDVTRSMRTHGDLGDSTPCTPWPRTQDARPHHVRVHPCVATIARVQGRSRLAPQTASTPRHLQLASAAHHPSHLRPPPSPLCPSALHPRTPTPHPAAHLLSPLPPGVAPSSAIPPPPTAPYVRCI